MEEMNNGFFTKKNIITLLMVCIMLLIIPVGVKLAQEQQTLKSMAASEASITFTGTNVSADKTTTIGPEVEVELRAPWPLESSVTPTPTLTPTSTSTPCYADADNDGYYSTESTSCNTPIPAGYSITQGNDCDDQNANVYPGQTGWFTTARTDGSFDYNCSAVEEKQYPVTTFPAANTCANNGLIAGTSGLQDGACGHSSYNLACWQTNSEAADNCTGGNGGWCYDGAMGMPCCPLGYPDYNSQIQTNGLYTQGCH